jgi:uncharacterized repeat protein (TIGR01451 family)
MSSTGNAEGQPREEKPAEAAGAFISNGTIQMGINDTGELNFTDETTLEEVGLKFLPLGTDGIVPGCPCEGWGAADATSGLTGYANQSAGTANVALNTFTSTATSAVSDVTISDPLISGKQMRVVHDYHPSAASPNLYESIVTITNTGSSALTDVRYRRAMDWDIEPTPFDEWVTIQGSSPQLLFDSDDGFASSNPLEPKSYIDSEVVCGTGYTGPCAFTDLGFGGVYPTVTDPDDHGALFDFGFGSLAVSESFSFRIFYGAAATETAALNAVDASGAEVYSLGEDDCSHTTSGDEFCDTLAANAGVTEGKPNTFIFGFVTTAADLSITKSDSPDPVTVGQDLTYTLTVNNVGPDPATNVQVTDTLPSSVSFTSVNSTVGSCSHNAGAGTVNCNLGDMANGATATITIHVTPNQTGSIVNNASASSPSHDDNPTNNTVSQTTTVNPVTHALTVAKAGAGSGTVTSSPPGIDCGADCSESYPEGTMVTLTATPGANSTFAGWSGGGCTGTGTCVVTMDAAKSVTATFNLVQRTLSVSLAGTGTGSVTSSPAGINCPGDCSENYDHGTVVTLTAAPGTGSTFAGWSGDCSGTGTCMVTMDAAKSVTATFNVPPPPPPPPSSECPGYEGVAGNHIVGTPNDDTLVGTGGRDIICGLEGDDEINGLGGNDILIGNEGRDSVTGGPGRDRILGNEDRDTLKGNGGDDDVFGHGGNDNLLGNAGDDKLAGGPGRDRCRGGVGNNTIAGCER